MNARNCSTTQKFIYYYVVGSHCEKYRVLKLRWPHQLDKEKQHIIVRKIDTDLEFFPGFHMLVYWVAYRLIPPLERTPQKWTRKLLPSHCWCSTVCLYLIILPSILQKIQVILSLLPVILGTETSASARSVHVYMSDLFIQFHFSMSHLVML